MDELQRKKRRLVYAATILCAAACPVLFAIITFCDTPKWFFYLQLLPILLAWGIHYSPWGRMVRTLPEEQAKKSSPRQLAIVIGLAVVFCLACGWLSKRYVTDWRYRADAAKAKELYRRGDYKAAWPHARQSFSGLDPEVWYIVGLSNIIFPRGENQRAIAEELLARSAEAGFPPAVVVWTRYQELGSDRTLTETDVYMQLLTTALRAGDRSAGHMLEEIRKELAAQISPVLRLAALRPPQCLSGFQASILPPLNIPQGHGGPHLEYALTCPCGNNRFQVNGFQNTDPEEAPLRNFLSPLSLICRNCERTIPLFDDCRDGYDMRIAGDTVKSLELRQKEKRGSTTLEGDFAIVVSLEYGLDEKEIATDAKLRDNLPDCFTWFTVYGLRDNEKPQELFSWECS